MGHGMHAEGGGGQLAQVSSGLHLVCPGIKLRPSGLAASTFSHRVISQAQSFYVMISLRISYVQIQNGDYRVSQLRLALISTSLLNILSCDRGTGIKWCAVNL